MIKHVLIDVDNTILDFDKCAKEALKILFKKYNLPFCDKTFNVFTKTNDEYWAKVEKRLITKDYLHLHRFNTVFERLKIDFDGRIIEKDFKLELKTIAIEVDGAKETLKYLSDKYNVSIASNSFLDQQQKRIKTAGLSDYISNYFVSEVIGFDKPDPRFFDYVLKFLKLNKDEIIFIGDSLSADIKGGINSNIKTIWFNPKNKPRGKIIPDYEVNSLLEIKKIL